MKAALRNNWDHYLIEAWGLGTFMFVAGAVAALLSRAPDSLAHVMIVHPIGARSIFGGAMGATAIAIVYSPWGARSGAHLNPAMTLAFAWLQKIAPWDAVFYVIAQLAGGFLGFMLAVAVFGKTLALPGVNFIVTKPGPQGDAAAFAAEFGMTFLLLTAVLYVSNAKPAIARFTGVVAGILVATFITFEAPISGMSLNPARTLASALAAHDLTSIWIYFTAPPLGMLCAAIVYTALHGRAAVLCAKLHHPATMRCHFRCDRAETILRERGSP